MTSTAEPTSADPTPGSLFAYPARWTDMDAWHRQVAEIRRQTPTLLVELPGYSPFLVLTRYADVFAVSRDSEHWLNTSRSVLGPDEDWQRMLDAGVPIPRTLIHLDGQDHADHRKVTNDWFKPAAVKTRQPQIDELADLFIDKMRDMGGQCDFARDVAQPFTLRVIMGIYGVPEEDEQLMLELTQGLFGSADPEFMGEGETANTQLIASILRFVEYFNSLTENRRRCPTDDLATVIANGMPGGCPMGDAERLWYYIIVATAGHDTTSFALSGGMEAIVRDPTQLAALRHEPDLAANAADECIRWTSPVRHFLRYATEDREIAGVTVPAGQRVLLSYPSANRDEEVFADSMTFDLRRGDADRLLSFGVGTHFCLGSQFARREVRTMLGKLAQELTHVESAGPAEWAASNFVSGVKHLPLSYSFR